MALFNKPSKEDIERDRILSQEFATLRYTSFVEAIKGEASIGSNDFKVTTAVFPEGHEIVFLTMEGKIFLARDAARPVNLSTFLFWSDLPQETKSTILMLAHDIPLNEHILSTVAEKTPEALPAIRGAINDATAEAVSYAVKNFDSYISIETEVALKVPRAMKILGGYGIPFDKIESTVAELDKDREDIERVLKLTGRDYSEVTISLLQEGVEDDTYEGRFLIAAAEVDCTLQDAWDQSAGFSWQAILEKLQELVGKEIIEIKFPVVNTALPADFEVVMSYEKLFRITKHIGKELVPLVEKIFVVSSDLDTAIALAEENDQLEERVLEIENNLIRTLRQEEYESFEGLSPIAQDSVRVLILDRQQTNTKREQILSKLKELLIVDTDTPIENEFKRVLNNKLDGIAAATDLIPRVEHEEDASHFAEVDEPVEFNYRDGHIVEINGEVTVQEIPHGAEVDEHILEPVFDPAATFDTHPLPYESNFDLGPAVAPDLEALSEHLDKLKAQAQVFREYARLMNGPRALEAAPFKADS